MPENCICGLFTPPDVQRHRKETLVMNDQEQTIDLRVLLKVLLEHILPILIVTALAAGIGFSLAKFVIPKKYTSTALMYVENTSGKQEDSTVNVNDLTAAQKLVNTCQILFTSNFVLGELNTAIDGKYTVSDLSKMIAIESVNSTEVLKITVTAASPTDAYDIANKLLILATDEFHRIIKGGSIETVSQPELPDTHTYPSAVRFAVIGGLIGLAVTYIFFLIKTLIDNKVKPEDDLAAMYNIPVFAEILDFETVGKGGKYGYSKYGYSKYGYSKYGYSSYDSDIQEEEKLYSDDDGEEDDDDEDSEEKDSGEKKATKSKKGELKNA